MTRAMEDDIVILQCDVNNLLYYVGKAGPEPLVQGARVAQTRPGQPNAALGNRQPINGDNALAMI